MQDNKRQAGGWARPQVMLDHLIKKPSPTLATLRRRDSRNVAGNVAVAAAGNIVTPIAALLMAPMLSRALGVDGRGEIAAATAPLLLVIVVMTFGLPEAVTHFVARSPHILSGVLRRSAWVLTLAGAAATVGCVAAAGVLSGGNHEIARLLVIASIATVPALLVALLRAAAGGLHAWYLVSAEQTVSAVLRLAVMAGFYFSGHLGLLAATIIVTSAPVIGGFVYLWLPRTADAGVEIDRPAGPHNRAVLSYGARIWIGSLSGIVLLRLDQAVMTPLSNAYQLGLYAVAANISEVPLIINLAARDVTFASTSAHPEDDRAAASARTSSSACVAFGIVIGMSLPFWVPVIFGAGFRASIGVCELLLFAVVVGTPGSVAGASLSARGHPGLRSASIFVAALVNVVLLFVLVPEYGAMGAAVATLVGNLMASNLNIYFLSRFGTVRMRDFYGLRRSDVQQLQRLWAERARREPA